MVASTKRSGASLLGNRMKDRFTSYEFAKRCIDVLASGMALVVLAPVLAIVAMLIRIFLGAPVLFAQPRPGLGGRAFTMFKFRSMRHVDPERGLAGDEERLTRFGRILRSTSLDELPALWNVLKGDMSLVGPRPLLVEYLPLYSDEQARRHQVRPGITGLAQVNGRNSIDWDEKFRLDVEYVDTRNLALDVKIIADTVRSVVQREGIAHAGHVTMTKFEGSA